MTIIPFSTWFPHHNLPRNYDSVNLLPLRHSWCASQRLNGKLHSKRAVFLKQTSLPRFPQSSISPCPPRASAFASPPQQPSYVPLSASALLTSSSAPPGAFRSAAWLALLSLTRLFLLQLQEEKWGKPNTGRFKNLTVRAVETAHI